MDMTAVPQSALDLAARLASKDACIAVIGLGYVGLPLSLAAVGAGFRVIGFDVDPAKVEGLTAGVSPINTIQSGAVAEANKTGRFEVTADFAELVRADAIIICVPTPLSRHREPDLSFVEATGYSIAARLRPAQLVVLESTTYPGTTAEVLKPILERSGLSAGTDFFLAFSPEREDPGNAHFETTTIPRVVGADDEGSRRAAIALYSRIVKKVVPVSSAATAEAVKVTENVFRAVNIALVNELKLIYTRMGIDVWEVIEAAKSKPFGFMAFYPGPGIGGHCIPIDPFYLTWKAREFDFPTRFIELAGEVNAAAPKHVVDALAEELSVRFRKSLAGARILMIGIAYKKNVNDMRESPAIRILEMIEARGGTVEFHDPFVPVIPKTREHAALEGRLSADWAPEGFGRFDAALVVTDHDGVDYAALSEAVPLVVDTRNIMRGAGIDQSKIAVA